MENETVPVLDSLATREIKKLYFVLLRVVEEDSFMETEEVALQARRLAKVFESSVKLYERGLFSRKDLFNDFDHLFQKLIEASLEDEMYERTANLTRVRELWVSMIMPDEEAVAEAVLIG